MIGESLGDLIGESVSIRGEKKAISFLRNGVTETMITYRDLNRDANRVANTLLGFGVQKGDRVILCFEKCLFFVVAHLAVQKIGAISVPLNQGFRSIYIFFALCQLVLIGVD